MSVAALLTRRRMALLSGVASTQMVVQVIGFVSGIVLIRSMDLSQYGYYTLAISLVGAANVLTDLGLSAAVMAIGGPLSRDRRALGEVVADANGLYWKLALISFSVVLPCSAWLLYRQNASIWEVVVLTLLVLATTAFSVRAGVLTSAVRLLGQTGFQQRTDLVLGCAKLGALMLAASLTLNAMVACLVNLTVMMAFYLVVRRQLGGLVEREGPPTSTYVAALKVNVVRQAPNSVYFVISGQLAVWLIGMFGNAERVAEAGALGRLGAVFSVLVSVTATLIVPYFARQERALELRAGFIAVNVFFAGLLSLLCALSTFFPAALLWVLGPKYGGLSTELVWMVAAATLAAWGGTLYSISCARGWVMPISVVAPTGILATILVACFVDVSTVRGSFQINTAISLMGVVVAILYFVWKFRQYARLKAASS